MEAQLEEYNQVELLKDLEFAIIHFELEGTNYLKDNILKFGFMLMIHMWSLMLKILNNIKI